MTSSLLRVGGDLEGGGDGEAGRAADQQPLLAGEPPGHRERVGVADRDHLVGDLPVERGRPDVLADALDQVRAAGPARVDRALRVGADDLDPAAGLLLEEAAGARDRAAGADARHEVGDPAVGLRPDLRTGPVVMRGRVVRVRVLVRVPRVGRRPGEAAGGAVVGVRVVGRHARGAHDDLGPVRAQHRDLVPGHLVRAGEHASVAALLGDDGQPDAGVPRRRLHDHPTRPQLALPLGRLDHPKRDAVLDRAPGVQVLDLDQDVRRPRDVRDD